MRRLYIDRRPHHKKREKASGSSRSNTHTSTSISPKPKQQAGSRKQVARGLKKQAAGIMQKPNAVRKNCCGQWLRRTCPHASNKTLHKKSQLCSQQPKKQASGNQRKPDKARSSHQAATRTLSGSQVAAGSEGQGASSQDLCHGWRSQHCHHTLLLQFSAPISECRGSSLAILETAACSLCTNVANVPGSLPSKKKRSVSL